MIAMKIDYNIITMLKKYIKAYSYTTLNSKYNLKNTTLNSKYNLKKYNELFKTFTKMVSNWLILCLKLNTAFLLINSIFAVILPVFFRLKSFLKLVNTSVAGGHKFAQSRDTINPFESRQNKYIWGNHALDLHGHGLV